MQHLEASSYRLLRALITNPAASTGEICELLEMPEEECSTVYDRLVDIGAIQSNGDLGEATVAPAEILLVRLAELHRTEQEARLQGLEQFTYTVSYLCSSILKTKTEVPQSSYGVRVIEENQFWASIEAITVGASEEIIGMFPSISQSLSVLNENLRYYRRSLENGPSVRLLHLTSMLRNPRYRKYLGDLSKMDVEVRIASVLPMLLVVVDSDIAYVGTPSVSADSVMMLEVREPRLIDFLMCVFEFNWMNSTQPAGHFTAGDEVVSGYDDMVDKNEMALLRLLADGLKDEAIAHSLGISPRTVRRLIAGLMRKLGVNSRFQIGAQAAFKGWIG